jgi:oxygen-dependent protoporphyrinogen oxidase
VNYFPSTVLLIEYDRPVFTPEVRALALDGGPCTNAGSYGAEDRHIVRYTFSGRAARAEASQEQLDEWTDAAEERLRRHIPDGRGAQRVQSVSTHWPAAYSAYLPFHGDFLADVRRAVGETPGLVLAGDYLRGVSIDACFRSGTDAAVELAAQLGRAGVRHAPPAEVAA